LQESKTHRHAAEDRGLGCLLGLAVGDAVGTTLEFRPPGTFEPIDDMVGGGPFGLSPGQWTDDTAMALCLATSLVETGGFDAADQMRRYRDWQRNGYLSCTGHCFDIGNTVSAALGRFARTGDPLAGSEDPRSAGNGSIMRLAPVAMFWADAPRAAIAHAAASSRTTHGAREAVDACRYFAALLAGAIGGAAKEELLAPCHSPVAGLWDEQPLAAAIQKIAAGSFRDKGPPAIVGSGYVVKSLEAALWAFARSNTFRDGCLLAANLGNDADTTAAVYGQLAGAYYGRSGIPEPWLQQLAWRDRIEDLAMRLMHHGCGENATAAGVQT